MPNALIMLLVADSVARVVIQETLEHGGSAVMAAGDLGTAVKRMSESTPDMLIVGPYIEDISGYDTAKFLRTKYHALPVLMVAGIIDDERLKYRLELEAFEAFPKPYSAAELLAKVKDMLARGRGSGSVEI
jgi:DNA-binding response OmpR family regulator